MRPTARFLPQLRQGQALTNQWRLSVPDPQNSAVGQLLQAVEQPGIFSVETLGFLSRFLGNPGLRMLR
jgi:hypothetical protein